jgi:AP endonuclease-2
MDARIRNLVAMGKRVFVTGDLNIAKGEIDAAHATEAIKKGKMTEDEFISAPARRVFNQLLSDGRVVGQRDEGRENPVLFDVCRSFHPGRRGMYTCWEQRINARPGNYGARIDYVLCSLDMQDWFSDSNIQEGLIVSPEVATACLQSNFPADFMQLEQGSDHCPVYAVFKDVVRLGEEEVNILDIMNPSGMFKDGTRQQEYSTKYLLPTSGRLIPEFDKRRSIKDMFSRKPSTNVQTPTTNAPTLRRFASAQETETSTAISESAASRSAAVSDSTQTKQIVRKRSQKSETGTPVSVKRSKSGSAQPSTPSTVGQRTLKGFFKPKRDPADQATIAQDSASVSTLPTKQSAVSPTKSTTVMEPAALEALRAAPAGEVSPNDQPNSATPTTPASSQNDDTVIDPIVSKEDWSKLFTKKPVPRCESHQEPCISLTTKKPGINCGRSFWICPRPLGPSGNKEKGTQWRCPTFIWASDWNPSAP